MRVASSFNPLLRLRPNAAAKSGGFADILANQSNVPSGSGDRSSRVSGDSFSRSSQAMTQRAEPGNADKETISSDPALCAAVAIVKPVAANYPATLTQEQIDDLKSRYDIPNMKWATYESVAFGEVLFALGAINDDQRCLFYGAVKYKLPMHPPDHNG